MSSEVQVLELPVCDFCDQDNPPGVPPKDAEYDAKTKFGPWANMCQPHYLDNRAYDSLGTGKGQRLVVGC